MNIQIYMWLLHIHTATLGCTCVHVWLDRSCTYHNNSNIIIITSEVSLPGSSMAWIYYDKLYHCLLYMHKIYVKWFKGEAKTLAVEYTRGLHCLPQCASLYMYIHIHVYK